MEELYSFIIDFGFVKYFSTSFREVLGYFVTVDMEELFAILGMIILWKGNGKSTNKRLIF